MTFKDHGQLILLDHRQYEVEEENVVPKYGGIQEQELS